MCRPLLCVFIQAFRTNCTVLKSHILTIKANECLPSKLAIFRVYGKMKIAKVDLLHNSITLLSLFMDKNGVTHMINRSHNLHVLIFNVYRNMILG